MYRFSVFFSGSPRNAAGPVTESTEPIFTGSCACADVPKDSASAANATPVIRNTDLNMVYLLRCYGFQSRAPQTRTALDTLDCQILSQRGCISGHCRRV